MRRPAALVIAAAVAAVAAAAAGLTTAALAEHHVTAGTLIAATTTTTLTVSRASVPGAVVTLAASETAADGVHPAGWVQFEAGPTNIGTPVAVSSAGLATTTAAIPGSVPASAAIRAAFTPATSAYLASATTAASPSQSTATTTGSIAVEVTVPQGGDLTVTVPTGNVKLRDTGDGEMATGVLQGITVTEYRNWAPGWSVSGQASDFAARGGAGPRVIPGTELGWVPVGNLTRGVSLGPAVSAGEPGLGSAGAVLAVAPSGSALGTSTFSADLTLNLPAFAATSQYTGVLTLTFLATAPPPASSGQDLLPQAG